jgi:hypothetical protein
LPKRQGNLRYKTWELCRIGKRGYPHPGVFCKECENEELAGERRRKQARGSGYRTPEDGTPTPHGFSYLGETKGLQQNGLYVWDIRELAEM